MMVPFCYQSSTDGNVLVTVVFVYLRFDLYTSLGSLRSPSSSFGGCFAALSSLADALSLFLLWRMLCCLFLHRLTNGLSPYLL